MAGDTIYMSSEGYEKARQELDKLKERRGEISKAIGVAREFGDISENAEYDSAKEEQAFNEKKIAELEDKLARAQILDTSKLPEGKVVIGTTVLLEDMEDGFEMEYTIVSELEADPSSGTISIKSPVAQGLLGHAEGDEVEIEVPKGTLQYKIKKITRRDA